MSLDSNHNRNHSSNHSDNHNLHKKEILTWHPDTNMTQFRGGDYPIVAHAEGFYLYTTHGRKLLDGISSWWCSSLGHSRREIVEAMVDSLQTKQHVILGGMSHSGVINLSAKIAAITPGTLNYSFYASDGASAVEAALRMAIQYWVNIGETGKSRFIALQDAYHGDTLGAVGVGFLEMFHAPLRGVVNRSHVAESPDCLQCPYSKESHSCDVECFQSMEAIVEKYHGEVAAVIIEPLIQGAGGVKIYPHSYVAKLRDLCDKYNILLIADEIAVGFYRTGEVFACSHGEGVTPDILVLGKALTAGYAPMSIAVANQRVYDSFENKIFWHSHTFGGYPAACEAALAVLKIYEEENIREVVRRGSQELRQIVGTCARELGIPFQTLGMVGMMRFAEEHSGGVSGEDMARTFTHAMVEAGVFVRPLGRVVYLWAPLTIGREEFDLIRCAFEQGTEAVRSL